MKESIQKKIIASAIISIAIVFLLCSAQFIWMKKYEKDSISFFLNLDPKCIDHIVINEIVYDNDHKKHYLFLKKISNPDNAKKFGMLLHSIKKFKPGEKPIFLRKFLLEIALSNGSKKELMVWIKKMPNDKLFIQFIKSFDNLKGLVKGYKTLGFAESKELKVWLDDQINLGVYSP